MMFVAQNTQPFQNGFMCLNAEKRVMESVRATRATHFVGVKMDVSF